MKNQVILKAFGLHIKKLRKERNLSQEELGLRAEVTELTIQRLEAAKYGTSIDNLVSISNALGLQLKELFDFDY